MPNPDGASRRQVQAALRHWRHRIPIVTAGSGLSKSIHPGQAYRVSKVDGILHGPNTEPLVCQRTAGDEGSAQRIRAWWGQGLRPPLHRSLTHKILRAPSSPVSKRGVAAFEGVDHLRTASDVRARRLGAVRAAIAALGSFHCR